MKLPTAKQDYSPFFSKGLSVMSINQNANGKRIRHGLQSTITVVVFAMLMNLAGCSNNLPPSSGSTSTGNTSGIGITTNPQSNTNLNGNWQLELTSTSQPVPFSSLAGDIFAEVNVTLNNASSTAMVASLQFSQPSSCFTGPTLVPFEGTYINSALNLFSFTIDGQYVTLTTTANSANNGLTGTYLVSQGCANGAAGTITGTKYSALTGTYVGPISGGPSGVALSTALTQSTNANGNGTFPVTGTATFTGVRCFTQGTLANNAGSVLGSSANLVFTTNETGGGSQVTVTGTFDAAASTITATSISVAGGSCSGSLGTASLVN
jgi:hypothetical protein